jgi:hypothetical protein
MAIKPFANSFPHAQQKIFKSHADAHFVPKCSVADAAFAPFGAAAATTQIPR